MAAVLVLAILPTAAAPSGGVPVIVTASDDVLEDLRADSRVQMKYDWPGLGALAGTVPPGLLHQLEDTEGVTVERDIARPLLCHSNGGDPIGCGGGGNSPPTASFTVSCTDLACDFDGSDSSDSDGTIESYDWDFGDGATGSGVTVSHTYGADGTYTVTLTVTDDGGATDSESKDVTVSSSDGGDGGGGGDARVSDQTPYGIEQIYGDATITATSGGAGVVLGHLDTGIDTDHIDLVNRIAFASHDDNHGHGTHTAGTAIADAGSDNLGIYGVAPDATVRSYRVCKPSGMCFTSDIVDGIDRCRQDGCDVITYSIGGGFSSSIHDAVVAFTDGGGLFVAAAGNDGPSLKSIDFPASMDETVAVGAINTDLKVPDFSSRGDDDGNCGTSEFDVDFAAAGVKVLSTLPDDGYGTASGTSMATPHVAGLALKEWGGDGATTYSNLQSNLVDITKGKHATTGCDPASGQGLPQV